MSDTVSGAVCSGRQTVTTPGTEVQLTTGIIDSDKIEVQALYTNTGRIVVGDSSISLTAGSEKGTILTPGQSMTLPISKAVKVYIDAEVAGEGVTYNIFS